MKIELFSQPLFSQIRVNIYLIELFSQKIAVFSKIELISNECVLQPPPKKMEQKNNFSNGKERASGTNFLFFLSKLLSWYIYYWKSREKTKKIEHFSNVKDFASGPFSKVSVLVYLLFKVSIDSSFENTPGPQDREECQYSSEFFCSWNSLLIFITAERSLQWRFNFF